MTLFFPQKKYFCVSATLTYSMLLNFFSCGHRAILHSELAKCYFSSLVSLTMFSRRKTSLLVAFMESGHSPSWNITAGTVPYVLRPITKNL